MGGIVEDIKGFYSGTSPAPTPAPPTPAPPNNNGGGGFPTGPVAGQSRIQNQDKITHAFGMMQLVATLWAGYAPWKTKQSCPTEPLAASTTTSGPPPRKSRSA